MAQNLRDKGYPSAKEYSPNRSDKRNAVMDKNVTPETTKTTFSETKRKESKAHNAMNNLVNAYTRNFFGTDMPRIHNIDYETDNFGEPDSVSERGFAVRDKKNNRLGYASSAIDFDDQGNRSDIYDIGIDNGNPNRGNLDISLNTPYGKLKGGFDQNTNYGSYQTYSSDPYGLQAYWDDERFATPLEVNVGKGGSDVTGGDMYYVDTNYPFNKDRYASFDTPLGRVSAFTSAESPFNDGYGSIEFDPNYYAQALANLLLGQR